MVATLPLAPAAERRHRCADIVTHQELVRRTLEVYASSAYESEDEVVGGLCSAGVARLMAERLVALVPLAFGRVLVSHMEKVEFSTSAILTARDGSSRSCDLRTDRIFLSALEIATAMYHEGPRHLFQAAASASAEVAAVNQLLDSGGTLAGGRFTEPRFLRLSFEEWSSADAFQS